MSEDFVDINEGMPTNTVEDFLRMERMPHIWCPGCGIGTTVNCFAHALETSGLDLQKVAIVSGIGCTGRVAGKSKVISVPHAGGTVHQPKDIYTAIEKCVRG